MYKVSNILMFFLVILFIFTIIDYYSSGKNIKNKNFNRENIEQIQKSKIKNLPILRNDTNNVIEFNNSLESELKEEKKRSFWNLLK